MKRFCLVLLALLLILPAFSAAKEKQREWQAGKVKSAELKDASGFTFSLLGPVAYKTKSAWLYIIETEKISYELLWPSEMPLHLTINGEVKLAPGKGNTYYLLDDSGKEKRLTIYKKTAKKVPTPEDLAPFGGG